MVKLDEDCNIDETPPLVLARAFIELKDVPDGIYDPSQDMSIAVLVDTDDSGDVSSGDTVTMGAYPLVFDPDGNNLADFGAFTTTTHTVDVETDITGIIIVSLSGQPSTRLRWIIQSNGEEYSETNGMGADTGIFDSFTNSIQDSITVDISTPSQPDTSVATINPTPPDPLDSTFLQIRLYPNAN